MMPCNCPPRTSVHAVFSRSTEEGRTPSHCQATEALSAASAYSGGGVGMVISEQAGYLAVVLGACRPVSLVALEFALLRVLRAGGCVCGRRWKRLAQVGGDICAVITGIKPREHTLTVRAFPDAYVEWSAARSPLRGIRTTGRGRRTPRQFLGGETFYAGMGQNAGQGCWEPEAVRQHVFRPALVELPPEKLISIQDLPED